MQRIHRIVLWALGGITFVAVGGLALAYANNWWLSGVVTASILAWLTGVLAAIYSRPQRRALVVGAVIAGFLYVLFALGPWFRGQVGSWLVTTQALVHVETKWLGRQPVQPPQAQQIFTTYPVQMDLTGSGYMVGPQWVVSPAGATGIWMPNTVAAAVPPTHFVEIGHWLCGWLAAGIGGVAAAWIARRRDRQITAQPLPAKGPPEDHRP
jgi:hypothetical protein